MKRCSLLFALTVAAGAAEPYFPPPDREGGWRMAILPAEMHRLAGMDDERLDRAFEVCRRGTPNGGLLVVRHGYLVYERYFGLAQRDVNPDMASTGKAYTAIACGIMVDEFKDKIPDGVLQKVFTPQYLPEAFPLDDPRRAQITLGQLLCMSAGYWGEGQTPTGVVKGVATPLKPVPGQNIRDLDLSSLRVPLWTDPGAGYSYSSPSPHIASMVLRRVTGMELQDYIDQRLAKPMGWGPWGYCLHRGDYTMPHANGAGSIAVHATDALRFAYCLLHGGKWREKQLVPRRFAEGGLWDFNPHTPFAMMFEQNSDGHVIGAPRDAYFKSGAGGFGIFVVPSLDTVIYKMGGKDAQYDPHLTDVPQPPVIDHSREGWQPIPRGPFNEGSLAGDDGLRRVLELVTAAVVD